MPRRCAAYATAAAARTWKRMCWWRSRPYSSSSDVEFPVMTYCVGLLVDTGLVMLSDSRTNAGVDQINTFRKMATFQRPNDRVLVLLSAGNLAITQAVVNLLHETPENSAAPARDLPRDQHVQCGARGGRCAARDPPARCRVPQGARPRVQRHVHSGRPDQGRGAAPVSHLLRRQLHRVLAPTRPIFRSASRSTASPSSIG